MYSKKSYTQQDTVQVLCDSQWVELTDDNTLRSKASAAFRNRRRDLNTKAKRQQQQQPQKQGGGGGMFWNNW